jgi:xanthine dehydrogenase accessory factor
MELTRIASALRNSTIYPCVLATLVNIEGSSYRRCGARLLWSPSGAKIGSISGGCLESDIVARAQKLIDTNVSSEIVTYDTTSENDLIWGVGTGCHGVVKVLLESLTKEPSWTKEIESVSNNRRNTQVWVNWDPSKMSDRGTSSSLPANASDEFTLISEVPPPLRLVVLGAGDDARPVTELCRSMDWTVEVFDPRPQMATAERFPAANAVRCLPAESTATEIMWDDQTVAVIMTHHYRYDLPLLQTLAPLNLPYLGLLGPNQRGQRLRHDAQIAENCVVHSPVGLDLGGDGPNAVALSIVAEIQAVMNQRSGSSLQTRKNAIHAD